jgi:hypothetical protein
MKNSWLIKLVILSMIFVYSVPSFSNRAEAAISSESLNSIMIQINALKNLWQELFGLAKIDTEFRLASGSVINVATCSRDDVQAAIDGASDGDTVVIPAGDCSWDSGVSVSKFLHIVGASGGTVELTHNGGSSDTLFAISESSLGNTSISNINFVQGSGGNSAWGGMFINVSGNTIATPTTNEPVLIYDNVFNQQGSARSIRFDTDGGVVWGNEFNNVGRGNVNAIAFAENTPDTSWAVADTMGDRDTSGKVNTYIEDNVFNFYPAQALDPDSNSRVVIRNNTFNETGIANHGADTSTLGVRHWELYDNDFNFTDYGDCDGSQTFGTNWYYYIRGGTGVITGNSMDDISSCAWANKPEIYMTVQNIRRNAGPYACWETYPAPRQVGQGHDGSSMITDPVYIWGNTGTVGVEVGNYNPDECGNGLETTDFIQEDRDYYVDTPKPGYSKYTYPHPLRAEAITPPESGPAAPTVNLSASPESIFDGNSSTLTWSSSNADSCTGSGFSTGGSTSGEVEVSPNDDTTYTVECVGDGGSNDDSVTVSVSDPPTGETENIFGSLTTSNSNFDNQPWDLGLVFTPIIDGQAVGARVYGASGESGLHQVRLWENDGTLLSGPHDFTYSGTGWHEYTFPAPVSLVADTTYTIVISTGEDANGVYSMGESPLSVGGNNGQSLTYEAGAGVYSDTIGVRPTNSYQNEHYMRDILFEADVPEIDDDPEPDGDSGSSGGSGDSGSSGGSGGSGSSGSSGGGGSSSRSDDEEEEENQALTQNETEAERESNFYSTDEEKLRAQLMAQIAELRALISSLLAARNNQIVSNPTPSNTYNITFNRALRVGMEGEDVRQLQRALNSRGFIVSNTGLGSPGQETTFFGVGTLRALQRFQCQRLTVCTGTPDTTGYGNVGPSTRNALR